MLKRTFTLKLYSITFLKVLETWRKQIWRRYPGEKMKPVSWYKKWLEGRGGGVLFSEKARVINPFPPSVPIWQRLAKLSILILEGTIKKISYERRDYESVDEKSLS